MKRAHFRASDVVDGVENGSRTNAPVRSTPVVANGVMYVMTEKTLYALEPKKK